MCRLYTPGTRAKMMLMSKQETIKPQPGQIVGIPLDGGGYALGWLTHIGNARKWYTIIGRYYAKRFKKLPSFDEAKKTVTSLKPAIISSCGPRGIHISAWKFIGEPLVPASGFAVPTLVRGIEYGLEPEVLILNEKSWDYDSVRPANQEDLRRECGDGGMMGDEYVGKRLSVLIRDGKTDVINGTALSLD